MSEDNLQSQISALNTKINSLEKVAAPIPAIPTNNTTNQQTTPTKESTPITSAQSSAAGTTSGSSSQAPTNESVANQIFYYIASSNSYSDVSSSYQPQKGISCGQIIIPGGMDGKTLKASYKGQVGTIDITNGQSSDTCNDQVTVTQGTFTPGS